jgi:hypothetical protein
LGDASLKLYVPPATVQQVLTQKGFHIIPMDRETLAEASAMQLINSVELHAGILALSKLANRHPTSWTNERIDLIDTILCFYSHSWRG